MTRQQHWQGVYETKKSTDVSWYAAHLEDSVRLIRAVAIPDMRIVDVGAGASTLVDDLLELGYRHLTVLDISAAALDSAKHRLGERNSLVQWRVGDITTVELDASSFEVWHDRAVFHFLTESSDRQAYVEQVRRSVVSGGHVVMGTFSLSGPTKCSGLDVVRYDSGLLSNELGDGFSLISEVEVTHQTPGQREQNFLFCCLRKH